MRRNTLILAAVVAAIGAILAFKFLRHPDAEHRARLDPPGWALDRAIDEAADYLSRANNDEGRFEYRVYTDGRHGNPRKYNIVRHAGAIYALGDYTTQASTAEKRARAGETTARATGYLLSHYVRPLAEHPEVKGVWSDPREEGGGPKPFVKLGAVGLSLIGLMGKMRAAEVEGAMDAGTPESRAEELATAEALGRFVQLAIKPAGDFRGKYEDGKGYVGDSESLYYPGEAILGLTMLYERDHDAQWLATGIRAINHLVQSRKREGKRLPNDHWLMIAIDRLLPLYGEIPSPPLSREDTLQHSVDIGKIMIEDMDRAHAKKPDDPELDGSFNVEGRTTPNATRLEGMLALDHCLEGEAKHEEFRQELRRAISKGIAFLRRSQVTEGIARGGQPAAIKPVSEDADSEDDGKHDRGDAGGAEREVRIDFVQHAMSAMMRYRKMCAAGGVGCDQPP